MYMYVAGVVVDYGSVYTTMLHMNRETFVLV